MVEPSINSLEKPVFTLAKTDTFSKSGFWVRLLLKLVATVAKVGFGV